MEKWIGNNPTSSQKSLKSKYETTLLNAQQNILSADEVVLKSIAAEFDKKSGKEINGILVLTNSRLLFISKYEHTSIVYSDINDVNVQTDGKDKDEWRLTLFVKRSNRSFDDIKKNNDAQEFFDILEEKIHNPQQEFLTTVTHNFQCFLHAEKLADLQKNNIKTTQNLIKRDNMGFSKNGTRLLQEKHPESKLILEATYHEKEKKGNFIVVDKLVWLYEYDNSGRKAKKILSWPLAKFNNSVVDYFAMKTEIVTGEGKLIFTNSGKDFVSTLSSDDINFIIKKRKWYQKILGFRSGKIWKKSIASVFYAFSLLIILTMIFGEDSNTTQVKEASSEKTSTSTKDIDKEKQKQEEAARIAEEKRKKEEVRIAEEKRQKEEAARIAEEKRKKEEAARIAEEKRQKEEEAAQAAADVYYPNCSAVEAAGAAPIHRGEPGYSTKLDRDRDGIACDQ
ncbi:excalibur calcium-binding domain-containing protein [Bacillus sp. UNCCL81]|uniref:excalibur calcium-binding domain-containing protein n=1 Tax=Bacillus sp. UNCCL81 TaxID=1502755 RepID=UPI0008E6DAF9|nr:excalibur calcium-binding domain-containing protein [Bacillus sp. UNCCL81]SFD34095.1 PH domain-containing protein [Bacillus sp. UNCCL81]